MTERRITKQIVDTSRRIARPAILTGAGSISLLLLACSPNPDLKAENVTINGLDSSSAPAGQAAPLPKDANQSPTLAPIPTATPTPITTEKTADQITNDREAQRRRTRELEEEACRVAAQLAAERIHYDNLVRIAKLSGQPTPQAPDPCKDNEVKPTPAPTATPSATPAPYVSFTAPEIITEMPIGIKSDSRRTTYDIIDKTTGAIVTNLQAPRQIDRKETGVGEKNDKFLTVILQPGQYVLTEAYLAERRDTDKFVFGPGAYIVGEAGSQKKEVRYFVSDGAMTVYANERDAMKALVIAVQNAERNGWDHFKVVFPDRWKVK